MASRAIRSLALILCALPALGFDVRTPNRGAIASFYFACPEYHIPPRVRAKAYTKEKLPSRTASWRVREFVRGAPPTQAYRVIGEVEVLARGHATTLADLHEKAKEAAEKMGGDVLLDVAWRDAGRTEPKIGERDNYVLTARIARFDQGPAGGIIGQ